MFYLAVFRARTQTIIFANLMRSYGANVSIVNTPRRLSISCGISVRFEKKYLEKARLVLSRRQFDTFAGIFEDI